jgi:hypothetical protein
MTSPKAHAFVPAEEFPLQFNGLHEEQVLCPKRINTLIRANFSFSRRFRRAQIAMLIPARPLSKSPLRLGLPRFSTCIFRRKTRRLMASQNGTVQLVCTQKAKLND